MQYKFYPLVMFLFSLFVGQLNSTVVACNDVAPAERAELIKFFNATQGTQWKNNNHWATSEPVFSWYGITISGDGCHVVAIDLNDNNLNGTLPNLQLPELQLLSLGNGKLTGNLPDFDGMPKLKQLGLPENELTGTIPNFSHLPILEALSLRDNRLEGSIPDFAHLPNLHVLYLGKNTLLGNLPNFSNLPNLEELHISKTYISGAIPNFNNLPNLKVLELNKNLFLGEIPNFDNLPKLKVLELRSNHLSGMVTNFTNLPILEALRLENNDLSAVPDFAYLPKLKVLALGYNQIAQIPDFAHLPELRTLVLCNNLLSGNVPIFTHLPALENLSLSFNQLTGIIPQFETTPKLKVLQLDYNELVGTMPSFNNLLNLSKLYLNNNTLNGNVPSFKGHSNLTETDFTYNQLTFDGLEQNASLQNFTYNYQQQIPLYLNNGTLSVEAGGNVRNNTYTWYNNNVLVASVQGKNTFVPTESGTYRCEITNKLADKLMLSTANQPVDAKNNQATNLAIGNIKVYPNYTNSKAFVAYELGNDQNVSINIYDLTGKQVFNNQQQQNKGTYTQELDFSTYEAAFYIVEVDNGQNKHIEKVLVAR